MMRRLLLTLSCGLVLLLFASTVSAQNFRADKSLYLNGRVGLNTYGGDRDDNPDNEISEYVDNIGFSFGVELGYHFTRRFSIGLMHISGDYPKVDSPRPDVPPPLFAELDPETTSSWRHHFNLIGRFGFTPNARVNPYLQGGLHLGLGKINDSMETGIGPVVGLGLDVAVNDRIGLFLEANTMIAGDDFALDAADPTEASDDPAVEESDQADFDAFNFYGLGLRFNFKRAFTPVEVLGLDCPEVLTIGEAGTFTATVNDDATQPVTYNWDFGDNMAGPGLIATHSYTQAGSFTVTFTADNEGSMDSEICSVRVIAPASVTTVSTSRTEIDTCEPLQPVAFNANVRGTAPITYQWDFGDGSTGTGATPSHTYREAGTYTVTLSVTNEAGTDTYTMTINVDPCDLACEVTDMNSVFFDRNSSVLTTTARQALQENLDIFLDCPDICAEIRGYAGRDERNASQLATDRARAVMQFYIDGGVPENRFTMASEVLDVGKKDASQVRRVDTLPGPCQ